MDRHRWNNVTRARLAYESGAVRAGDAPLEAFFEVSARCNLRCTMCAINFDSRYQPKSGRPPYFRPELFAKLRPIFPSLLKAYLFGLGEPTLNPHLIDYITELSSAGAEVGFNTNATIIDEAKADAIARAGAHYVTVSIDGTTPATYEAIRRGASFDDVIRGIRALCDASRRYGNPRVDLSMVAMRANVEEVPALVALAAECGVAGVHVEPLFAQVGSPDLDEHYARENLGVVDPSRIRDLFDESRALATTHGIRFGSRFNEASVAHFDYVEAAKTITTDWACSEPWSAIWVTSAGEVRTCCVNEVSFGNLNEQSFDAIWNGAAFRRLRDQHRRRTEADGCGNCIANGRKRNSPYFRATEPVTYHPSFASLPPPAPDDPVVFHSPTPGRTVLAPLEVRGHAATDIELLLDHTPFAHVRGDFALRADLPYVSEGAHMLWGRDPGGRGWGWREVHLWRG